MTRDGVGEGGSVERVGGPAEQAINGAEGSAEPRSARGAALVVVHGIGAQPPLRTLGLFAQGLARATGPDGARFGPPELRAAIVGGRLRPCVRFEERRHGGAPRTVDVFEYHWAEHSVEGMSVFGSFAWLLGVNLAGLDLRRQVPFIAHATEPGHLGGRLARQLLHVVGLAGLAVGLLVVALLALSGAGGLLAALEAAWNALPALGALQAVQLFAFLSLGATLCVLGRDGWLAWREGARVARLHAGGSAPAWRGMYAAAARAWRGPALVGAVIVLAALALVAAWARGPLLAFADALEVLVRQPSVLLSGFGLAVALAARWVLRRYVNDIALYVTSDRVSKRARTRRAILDEGEAFLRDLLAGEHAEVYLAGHSLGSVIAVDLIDRLARRPDALADPTLGRLRGLLTFGSPLDKVAYFFRQRPGEGEAVRAQLLSFLHGVRRRGNLRDYGPYQARPYELPFGALSWWQVHAPGDLLSDRLIHYRVDRRVILRRSNPFTAHGAYWSDATFFRVALDWMGFG
ncbi:MAG: hypothetical protein KF875_13570 [Trueperaceae bacterium]|nr:hypothetical protein [Trueperaceae bacterium]MCO5173866.1 hypothetical protein [Trueperaceae bacterium]